jgi:hypothetical protein
VEPYASEEINAFTPEEYDEYISAQVILPIDSSNRKGRVLRRKRNVNGEPIGLRNINPLLDTREYDVIFPEGAVQSYLANDIAEGIYSQADQEGHSFVMLSEIIDHEVALGMKTPHLTLFFPYLALFRERLLGNFFM